MLANYGKRILSFLLALVMVFSAVPVQAFATEVEHDHEHDDDTIVVESTPDTVEEVQPLHEHAYAETVTPPTCGAAGYTTYTCDCGHSYVGAETPATGEHQYSAQTVDATPEAQGYTQYTCACGDTYQDNFVDYVPAETETEPSQPVHEHSYVAGTPVAATPEAQGYTTYACECGDSYQDDFVDYVAPEVPVEDEPVEDPRKDWTDEMLEIQTMIDEDVIEYWLTYYGFEMPQEEKFADLIRIWLAELNEEEPEVEVSDERRAELAAEWEEIHAQIEDVVINKMSDNERENAFAPLKEVQYLVEAYTEAGLLTEEQQEELFVANPVYLDFAVLINTYGVEPEHLVTGSLADTQIGLTNSKGTWNATGTQITGSIAATKLFGSLYVQTASTLTIKNNRPYPVNLAFNYTFTISGDNGQGYVQVANGTKYSYTSSGASDSYTGEIPAGGSVTVSIQSENGQAAHVTSINITDIVASGTVTFAAGENGTYTVNGEAAPVTKTDACGTTYTLVATPADGYAFAGWFENDSATAVSNEATYTYTNNGSCTVAPKFMEPSLTVEFAAAEGSGSYTVNGAAPGTLTDDIGTAYTLVATPNSAANAFVGWFKDAETEPFSTEATLTITTGQEISANCKIYPKFRDLAVYNITAEYNTALGSVTGAGQSYEGNSVTLTAAPNSGSTFLGWTDSDGKILSTAAEYAFAPTADVTVKAAFASATSPAWFRVDKTYLFNDLNAAAAAGTKIVLAADGTLPAGDYTIPSGKTLLIPFDDAETLYTTEPALVNGQNKSPSAPSCFRTLYMASGANLTISGAMSLSAKQFAAGGSKRASGMPDGTYSYVKMDEGSSITVPSGGALYCYGYINGSGTVTAKSGAIVYESFQFEDFRGGSQLGEMVDGTEGAAKRVFPMNSYYVQNIMVPLTLESGAKEYGYASFTASSMSLGTAIVFISNDNSMFNLKNGSVTKRYDHASDRLILDADGDVEISNIKMSVSALGGLVKYDIDSKNYDLPINGNMTVNINSGSITLTQSQNVALLPGAVINIGENATCSMSSGASMIVYDLDGWGNFVGPNANKMLPAYFVPERTYTRNVNDLKDAEINIDGNVTAASGYVYTTGGGAAINGVEGASAAVQPGLTDFAAYQLDQSAGSVYYEFSAAQNNLTSAKLRNADGSYLETASGTGAGTYRYSRDFWHTPACNAVYSLDKEQSIAATCTESGLNVYVCGCGHSYEETVKATGHSYTSVVTAPTCTEKGFTTHTCNNPGCDDVKVDTYVDAKGHTWGAWVTETAATCVADGYRKHTCTITTCNVTEGEAIPKLGHAYGEWSVTTPATCEKTGIQTKTCSNAGCPVPAVTEEIPATNHASKTHYPAKDAICNNDGSLTAGNIEYWQCDDCMKYFSDAEGTKEISLQDTIVSAKHDMRGIVTSATCTEDKYTTYTCSKCGYQEIETEQDSALGHDLTKVPKVDATCGKDGSIEYYVCANNCGNLFADADGKMVVTDVVIPATGHVNLPYTEAKEATCTEDGNVAYFYCKDCGTYYQDAQYTIVINAADVILKAGHKMAKTEAVAATCTEAGNIEYYTCSGTCKGTYADEAGKQPLEANAWITSALGHDMQITGGKAADCENDGYIEKTCKNGCGHTETIVDPKWGHNYEAVVTAPTCEESGFTTYTCKYSDCGHTYTADEVPATGHDWSDWITSKNPTCEEAGEQYRTCSVSTCGKKEESVIPATGHNYPETWTKEKDPTCTEPGSEYRICTNPGCGDKVSQEIPATGHNNVDHKAAVPATCLAAGNKEYWYCGDCSNYYLDAACTEKTTYNAVVLTKLNHNYQETGYVDPTCTENGQYVMSCSNGCGKSYNEEDPNATALGHSFTVASDEVVSAANCEHGTIYWAKCEREGCDEISTEKTIEANDKLNHSFVKEISTSIKTQATCTTNAVYFVKCDNCDAISDTVTVEKPDSALGHSWDDGVIKVGSEPSCMQSGIRIHTCTVEGCGATIEKTAPALGHDMVPTIAQAPTCTTSGQSSGSECSRCDYAESGEIIPELGHSFTLASGEIVSAATCEHGTIYKAKCEREGCGEISDEEIIEAEDKLQHSFNEKASNELATDADCKNAATYYVQCDNCDAVSENVTVSVGEPKEHSFTTKASQNLVSAATCTAKAKYYVQCDNCEAVSDSETVEVGNLARHSTTSEDIEATCTTGGYTVIRCTNCTYEKIQDEVPSLGHRDDITLNAVVPTCTETGLTEGKKCSRCNEITVAQEIVDATGHKEVEISAIAPTCLRDGLKAGVKCETCGTVLVKQETDPKIPHTEEEISAVDATCTTAGLTPGVKCAVCNTIIVKQEVIPALKHNSVVDEAKEPTCTENGLTEGAHCDRCGEVLKAQETVEATGHTRVPQNAVEPTCTETGLTKGEYCSACNEVLVAQTIVPAKGHSMTHTAAKDATCTEEGNVEFYTCGTCGNIYADEKGEKALENTVIDAIGHDMIKTEAKAATCTATGNNTYYTCGNCDGVFKDEAGKEPTTVKNETLDMIAHQYVDDVVPATCTADGYTTRTCENCDYLRTINPTTALGHRDDITLEAVAPKCTETGLTEGKKCSRCNEITVAQEIVDATGHKEVEIPGMEASCWYTGWTAGVKCETCGITLVEQETIEKIPHTEVEIPAKEATCTETGLTAGVKCSVSGCGEILTKQEVVAALGHNRVVDEAVAPTCKETGLTEGAHCDRCDVVFVAQEIVEKLPHTEVVDAGQDPTCTEPGISEGKHCSVCETVLVEQTEIEAKGHKLTKYDKQLPTNYSSGWEAYETCSECEYTTYVEIPAIGEPEITDYGDFLYYLQILEGYANEYVQLNPSKDPMALLIKYVRTGVDRYNSGSWNIMAGYEDADFAKFVKDKEEAYNRTVQNTGERSLVTGMKNIHKFTLPNGDMADIGHMFGTMDISYHNNNGVNHADVAGWAGDTVDLVSLSDQFGLKATELEAMIEEITENYFMRENEDLPGEPDEGTFSRSDVYGDLDGYYVMQTLWNQEYEPGLLYSIISNYFTANLSDEQRAEYFLKNRLGGVTSRADIRNAVLNAYTGNSVVATLEGTRNFKTSDLGQLRTACCYTFADYLCKLAGDYTEKAENRYYSVFSTEKSTLAPGITQEIHQAYTADNKQIRYYVATADINSPYVDVYANYKDNDPGAGWAMSRVLDQANAAQAKYGDPSSPHYIENYNVIASINGAGYNMATGEPSGLLVMGGVEYHAPNANGFFGILKDGTAYIGTTEEYYAMKDQVQEGIAGFGATLIKNGKIVVSHSDSYTNDRASRTSVGITRTGKVVFMVLDGRQEPISCGGSMQEIAQIMLDAGCDVAINLDGGGSTTYVAKQEGDDKLSLVSNPSDGYERSVSASLMMVSTAPSSTAFHHAILEAEATYLTIGSSVNVIATGASATGNPAELPDGTKWTVSDGSVAQIDQNGTVTALSNGTVDVKLMLGDEVLGSKTMNVVVPTTVYFERDRMDAIYGEPVLLPVRAKYNGKKVIINENDVVLSLDNAAAGSFDGFSFTAVEGSGLKSAKVIAALKLNASVKGYLDMSLFSADEASFDFDNATGGDRQFAWLREISNATTEDDVNFMAVDTKQPMVTDYTFAIDMTQIPIPEVLADLTSMLPGSDVEGASAWTFLLQLAERVSVLTEVKPVVKIDPNFDVDYSNVTLMNDYFELEKVELNKETNELTMSLRWIDQTMAIDPTTANPLCILSGIKLTPKADADWGSNHRLTVEHTGKVGYTIYLRASALYSFASKEENQKIYNLYPFTNPDDPSESGGYFSDIYAEFADEYTLINSHKSGWVYEDGGYAYYENDERLTGICQVEGYYYDFGEDGINDGRTKYTGMLTKDGKTCYAKFGLLASGWVYQDGKTYCFDENGVGYDGTVLIDEVPLTFADGLLVGGHTGFITKSNGRTFYYEDGNICYKWKYIGGHWYHFHAETGVMTTGLKKLPDDRSTYYDFAEDGKLLRGYFNKSGYYYWAGKLLKDSWVKAGNDPDPDAWYRTNGGGHFVTDLTSKPTVKIDIGGVIYTFDNTNGKLLRGDIINVNGSLYYYWAGKPYTGGWFQLDNNTYYASLNGKLATGQKVIDGKTYQFDKRGVLMNGGIMMDVTLNEDDSIMEVSIINVKNANTLRVAVWSEQAGKDASLRWYKIQRNNFGEWVIEIPMCVFNRAGAYQVHVYNDTNKFLISERIKAKTVADHVYSNDLDDFCDLCGEETRDADSGTTVMYRMYNPNSGEHFYTGSTEERDILVAAGWRYEGIAFNFPTVGEPVYRVYHKPTGEHLYTMDVAEKDRLLAAGWRYEGVAFNSASPDEVPQYRLYNRNATVGAYHFTSSTAERDMLIAAGWKYQGIGWYSCLK